MIYGESLGSGAAVEMGTKYEFLSIVLEAPFTSVVDIGQNKYPIYPVKFFTLDKFDNLSKIDRISSPLLIINGKKDEVIPYTHGLQLFQKANEPKQYLCVDEAMHSNLYEFNIDKEVINFNN